VGAGELLRQGRHLCTWVSQRHDVLARDRLGGPLNFTRTCRAGRADPPVQRTRLDVVSGVRAATRCRRPRAGSIRRIRRSCCDAGVGSRDESGAEQERHSSQDPRDRRREAMSVPAPSLHTAPPPSPPGAVSTSTTLRASTRQPGSSKRDDDDATEVGSSSGMSVRGLWAGARYARSLTRSARTLARNARNIARTARDPAQCRRAAPCALCALVWVPGEVAHERPTGPRPSSLWEPPSSPGTTGPGTVAQHRGVRHPPRSPAPHRRVTDRLQHLPTHPKPPASPPAQHGRPGLLIDEPLRPRVDRSQGSVRPMGTLEEPR
jgi:hypothetical protein